jgi:uncharacterized protein YcnI
VGLRRYHRRPVVAGVVAGLLAALVVASPAYAHTDVEITPARAGARNALVTVHAAAESNSAGIRSIQVFLPAGIAPADVRLVSAPSGWRLTTGPDFYTVAGRALPVGTDANHRVRVRQLPTDPVIYFKILQTYGDGRVDRWIEVPSAANPDPDNPAPGVRLAGGTTRGPTPSPSPTTAPAPTSAAPAPTSAVPVANEAPDGGSDGLLIGLGLVVLAAAAVTAFVLLRRRRPTT